jgi:hypothetical protein
MKINLENLQSNEKDSFGRKIPKKISLNTGETIYGHFMMNVPLNDAEKGVGVMFKIIENLDDWILNKIKLGSENRIIFVNDILSIVTFEFDNMNLT